MTASDFNTRYEDTLLAIEDTVEVSGEDLDFETVNNILTLTCVQGTAIIITKQSATEQLWLAAKSGGFHFDMHEDGWVCTTDGERLSDKLRKICQEQAGVNIQFS